MHAWRVAYMFNRQHPSPPPSHYSSPEATVVVVLVVVAVVVLAVVGLPAYRAAQKSDAR